MCAARAKNHRTLFLFQSEPTKNPARVQFLIYRRVKKKKINLWYPKLDSLKFILSFFSFEVCYRYVKNILTLLKLRSNCTDLFCFVFLKYPCNRNKITSFGRVKAILLWLCSEVAFGFATVCALNLCAFVPLCSIIFFPIYCLIRFVFFVFFFQDLRGLPDNLILFFSSDIRHLWIYCYTHIVQNLYKDLINVYVYHTILYMHTYFLVLQY